MHKLLFILFLFIQLTCFSQDVHPDSLPRNSILAGIIGERSHFSLLYERFFPVNNNAFLCFGTGFGYNVATREGTNRDHQYHYLTVPHRLSFNYGTKSCYMEAGIGGVVLISNEEQITDFGSLAVYYPLPYGVIGFRFRPSKPNIEFRVFYEAGFNDVGDGFIFMPFGVSLGYVF